MFVCLFVKVVTVLIVLNKVFEKPTIIFSAPPANYSDSESEEESLRQVHPDPTRTTSHKRCPCRFISTTSPGSP